MFIYPRLKSLSPLKAFLLLICINLFLIASDQKSALAQSVSYETTAKQAILIDLLSGQSLYEKNADEIVDPASMTKMMTIYLIFERLQRGILSLEDEFIVSHKAWKMEGSKMFVEVDKKVKLGDLIHGIIVQSGNDATIVVGEAIAGSEEAFAELMTAKALELGMNNTQFLNASGWPEEGHHSTARDLSILAIAIINNFPEYYHLYSEKEFTYNGIRQPNRNPILGKIEGVDGLKTGHVSAAGYGFTGSAIRNGRRLVMVIHGLNSENERREEASKLLEWGYANWGYYRFFSAGSRLAEVPVWLGNESQVQAILNQPVAFNLPRKDIANLSFNIIGLQPLPAPIAQGDTVATLQLRLGDTIINSYPLVAAESVEKRAFLGRIGAAFQYLIFGE